MSILVLSRGSTMRCMVLVLSLAAVSLAAVTRSPTNFVGYLSHEAQDDYHKYVRIINGSPVVQGEVGYQIGLIINIIGVAGTGFCGGSLVSSNRVITAAHCWHDGINWGERVQLVFGATRINEQQEGSLRINTDEVHLHPSWNPNLIRNDIAMIYVPQDVPFSDTIYPVRLPQGAEEEDDFAGRAGFAYGWGITSNTGNAVSPDLLGVEMPIITVSACQATSLFLVTEDNICTSGLFGGAVCNGDSGGPLVVNQSGEPVLVGVTSFRHLFGCESVFPSMFVRVTSFLPWIRSHLE